MPVREFRYGPLSVRVRLVGEGSAPWDERGSPRHEYRVTVSHPAGPKYTSSAWGSVNDFETGETDHRGMARMVVDELYSAAADPDEFVDMAIGEERGRKALEAGKRAERVVRAAAKFGQSIFQAGEAARREEERGGADPREWSPREA